MPLKKKIPIFVAFLFSLFVQLDGQTNLYVKPNGNKSNSGYTWNAAKATLAGALSAVNGTTHIYMMVGEYSCSNVTIPNGVTVTGGYASSSTGTDLSQRLYPGTNANWDNTLLCTILNGNNGYRVATVNSGGTLEGCVITRGKTSGNGGGVLINGGTVQHCAIIHNTALDEAGFTAKGGGAYVQNNGRLLNCVCAFNIANNGPGAAGTNGQLTNNTITRNNAITDCGTVTDYDGNTYNTVVIGEQCWMRENLRSIHYANGTTIPLGSVLSTTTAYRYYPNNNSANVSTYGYLYNWAAVMRGSTGSEANPSGVRGICPTGWHVPSYAEQTQMWSYLVNNTFFRCGDEEIAIGKSLASTTGWSSTTTECSVGNQPQQNNTSGFGERPAGYYTGSYAQFGQRAFFWTTTEINYTDSRCYGLINDSPYSRIGDWSKDVGLSVRCLRD